MRVEIARVVELAGVAGQADHAGDQGRRQARPAHFDPPCVPSEPERVVDGEPGVGVGHGGHVGHRAHRAVRVVLPGRFVDPGRAAAAGSPPGGLVPDAECGRGQVRPPDGDQTVPRCRERGGTEALIPGGRNLRHARMGVVSRRQLQDAVELDTAVGVRHDVGAEAHGRVHRPPDVGERRGVSLHQQDVAVRTRRRYGLHVQRDLDTPSRIRARRRGAAALVDLPEAAVRRGAGWQPPRGAIRGEIRLHLRVVERIDDRDRLSDPTRDVELVGGCDVRRAIAGLRQPDRGRAGHRA